MLFRPLPGLLGFLTPSLAGEPWEVAMGLLRADVPVGRVLGSLEGREPGLWTLSRPVQYRNLLCGRRESLRTEGRVSGSLVRGP